MNPRSATDPLQTLLDTLWAERQVVEFLLFKLITAKLLLVTDERRFVVHALDEVDRVVDALREAELRRAIAVAAVARQWHVPEHELTLKVLARRAPDPWREVFVEHDRAFSDLAAEIDETTDANRTLAAGGLDRIRETMDIVAGVQQMGASDAATRARTRRGPRSVDAVS